jgi:diaminobutyrate-2-oxoglutarate transaminase
VQGEGGINVARGEWLQGIERLCRKYDILLIIDDVQMGCGRTGTFFSFEPYGIKPDLVCLSKSIGGYGLPMALTLIKSELDIWEPGEHNGTFRGNNLAFVCATEALSYWESNEFTKEIHAKGLRIEQFFQDQAKRYPEFKGQHRGRGLMQGIAFAEPGVAEMICKQAFELGLIMETSGTDSEVAKVMPPLTIDSAGLDKGLSILAESMRLTYSTFLPKKHKAV